MKVKFMLLASYLLLLIAAPAHAAQNCCIAIPPGGQPVCTTDTTQEACPSAIATFDPHCAHPACDSSSPSATGEEGIVSRGLGGTQTLFSQFFVPGTGFNPDVAGPEIILAQIVQGLIFMIGVIFAVILVYGGYLWMTARGNEEQIKKAQGILKTVVVGFIIVSAAYAITSYVIDKLVERAFV